MFGFFNKKAKPSPAAQPRLPNDTPPSHDVVLLACIVKLRAGDQSVLPVFFKSLSHVTVTVPTREPGQLATGLMLESSGGHPLVAVFTKAQLSEKWQAQGFPHLMQIPMKELATRVTSDQVGLTINPDHPIFGCPLPPAGFKLFRDVVASMRPALKEGGIYFVRNEDDSFSVLKILKLDECGVHIRQYSNAWPVPPGSVDESTLYMAGMDRKPEEKLGMGHLPISKQGFAGWNAVFVQQSTVSEEELEGYGMWKEAKGGYF